MRTLISILLLAGLGLATPALAKSVPSCPATNGPGLHITYGFSFGGKFTDQDKRDFWAQQLHARGIDATFVDSWGGCVRAFVREPGKRQETMHFYDPDTLEEIILDN